MAIRVPQQHIHAVALLLLLGCASDKGSPAKSAPPIPAEGPWQLGLELPSVKQNVGNEKAGRDLIFNGGYMGCGIPARLLDSPLLAPAIKGALGAWDNGQKLPGRNERNKDLSYSMNIFQSVDGVEVVNIGCLMCHAGSFNGELVVGLGTADTDFTNGFGAGNASAAGPVLPPFVTDILGLSAAESNNLNKMLSRSAAFTGITAMRTVGQNPAESMAIALMAHHHEDLSWSDQPVVDWTFRGEDGEVGEPVPFPSDVPPWWRAKKKSALFYNAMARGDHSGSMALATSICVDSTEQAREIGKKFKDMHAYVLSLEAPKYPFEIDRTLAGIGEALFIDNCAGCHGTYGASDADDTYPNLLFPLEVIGTDAALANGGVLHAPQMVASYNKTYYGQTTPFVVDDPAVGYVAPPLDGIWATGPFLHNGSVPTIELVLNSGARPTYWRRVDYDSKNFDAQALGWPFMELSEEQVMAAAADAKHIYDTTQFGQRNQGHLFGDHLTSEERLALLEYLKTL